MRLKNVPAGIIALYKRLIFFFSFESTLHGLSFSLFLSVCLFLILFVISSIVPLSLTRYSPFSSAGGKR